jgi:hypothetical protein
MMPMYYPQPQSMAYNSEGVPVRYLDDRDRKKNSRKIVKNSPRRNNQKRGAYEVYSIVPPDEAVSTKQPTYTSFGGLHPYQQPMYSPRPPALGYPPYPQPIQQVYPAVYQQPIAYPAACPVLQPVNPAPFYPAANPYAAYPQPYNAAYPHFY